jgi:hypothetical protein
MRRFFGFYFRRVRQSCSARHREGLLEFLSAGELSGSEGIMGSDHEKQSHIKGSQQQINKELAS